MKTRTNVTRILSAFLCLVLIAGILPTSVFAAKENFATCNYIGIRNCTPPAAGEHPDVDVTPYSPGQYEILSVNWYKGENPSIQNIMGSTMHFEGNTVYTVEFEVWTKDAYTFTTDANGYTTVTADVSPNYAEYGEFDAQVYNVYGKDNTKHLTVRCTFPATEKLNSNDISSVTLTGLELPVHHLAADTSVSCSDYRVSTEVVWKNQDGSAFSGVFEYGKSYTAMIYLFVNNNCDFAKDYTHPLATSDKPMPAVTVTLDGETLSVVPDYTRNQFMRCLVASKVFKCEGKLVQNSIRISGVTEPTAGGAVNYSFNCDTNGYERLASMDDTTYYKGVAWRVDGGIYLETSKGTFDANETYQIVIRLKPMEGFEFDADSNGNTRMTATVNGKAAEVKSSKTEAIVTYTFPKTGNAVLDKVDLGAVDAPEAGKSPDYSVSYGANYGAANYNDKSTKNGVSWYNETDKKIMSTSDTFEEGKTYSVRITIWANDGYEFGYKSGSVSVAATVNGQNAEVSSRDKEEVTVYYTFPKIAEHKHAPLKVDEIKATCKEEGKKAYYFCPECGKNFEDSKCTKEITNINAWGVIPMLTHTGGKATCTEKAICKRCGDPYGDFGAHSYGSTWDYKDATGHAHTCKVCDAPDTIQPHSGGTATCGKIMKCAECKAEYGEVVQHQWSTDWAYKDGKGHAHKCTLCGERDTVQEHSGGTADCQNKAKCAACGTEYGKLGEHKWSAAWDYSDKKGHAHKCTVQGCSEHGDTEKHTPGAEATETSAQTCTACQYVIEPAKSHKHDLKKVAQVKESCTEAGMKQHFVCEGCGKLFSDSKGNTEITDTDTLVIPATGHKESKWRSDEDTHWKECTNKGCDAVTVEKEAHDFGENGKCKVCKYNPGSGETDPEETEPEDTDPDTDGDTTDTNAPADDPSDDKEQNASVTWILVAAAAVIAVIGAIAAAVILKKKKKA